MIISANFYLDLFISTECRTSNIEYNACQEFSFDIFDFKLRPCRLFERKVVYSLNLVNHLREG